MPLSLLLPRVLVLLPVAIGALLWGVQRSVTGFSPARRRLSLGLRITLVTLVVLALAMPVLRQSSSAPTLVMLVDVSDSVSEVQLARARRFVDDAWGARNGAPMEVVTFAGQARRAAPKGGSAVPVIERHDGGATDLAAAVVYARGLVPEGAARLVLITDGNETRGDGVDAIERAIAGGATLEVVRLGEGDVVDARVTALHLPDTLRRHEPSRVGALVESSGPGKATVRFDENGILVEERTVELKGGPQEVDFELSPNLSGLVKYSADVELAGDQILGNNRFVALADVAGPPRVLLAAATPDDGRHLEETLAAQEFGVEATTTTLLPSTVDDLLGYDEVILAGVSPHELTPLRQAALATYVRDTGGGLLYVSGSHGLRRDPQGGENVLERVLPVELAAPSERQEPPVAIVLLVDRSSSMIGEKLGYAKQAAIAVVDKLSTHDQVGVIAFDADFEWVVPLTPLDDKERVKSTVGNLGAGGGTRFYPALEDAYFALGSSDATVKHAILLTDGESTDPDIFPALMARMRKNSITVSTVAIGRAADNRLLGEIAKLGGGRFSAAVNASDVPTIFVKETQTVQRDAAQRTDTQARVATAARELAGIDFASAPPLHGYLQTKAKPMSEVLLETDKHHPLLARWRYGIGQVAVFTSDATTAWASSWIGSGWSGYGKLWAQLARGLQRPRAHHDLALRVTPRDGRVGLTVEAIDQQGRFIDDLDVRVRLIAGDQAPREVRLAAVGPGRYAADADDPGGSLLMLPLGNRAGRRLDGDWVTLARPYPPELRAIGGNKPLLDRLEKLGKRADLPAQLFASPPRPVPRYHLLSMPLTVLAALLFLLDLFVKRARWAPR
jgi:Mg-chelatase subunit ChlD